MIQLITREKALAGNKAFESYIFNWQEKLNNPMHSNNSSIIGENLWDNIELRYRDFLTQEDCDAYDQKMADLYLIQKDSIQDHGIEFHPPYKFIAKYGPPRGYFNQFGRAIKALLTLYRTDSITLLCHWPLSVWLARENDFKHGTTAASFKYLKSIGVTEATNGGIQASGDDIDELLYHYSIGGAEVFDYCFFRFGNLPMVADICKYGALHLNITTEVDLEEIKGVATSCGLARIDECVRDYYERLT